MRTSRANIPGMASVFAAACIVVSGLLATPSMAQEQKPNGDFPDNELKEKDPTAFHLQTAFAHARLGENDKAAASFAQAVEAAPSPDLKAIALYTWGQWLQTTGAADEAKAKYREAIALGEGSAAGRRAMMGLAIALEKEGDIEGAARQYEMILAMPSSPREQASVRARLLAISEQQGKLDEVIAAAEKSLQEKPDDEAALQTLLAIYTRVRKNPEAALPLAQRFAEMKPNDFDALSQLADLQGQTGQADKAAETYQAAAVANPAREIYCMNRIVDVYSKAEEHAKAVEWAAKLTEKNPQGAMSWLRLGQVQLKGGRKEEALKTFQKAVETAGPGEQREAIQLQYAEIMRSNGQTEEAKALYKELAENAKSEAIREIAGRRLETFPKGK